MTAARSGRLHPVRCMLGLSSLVMLLLAGCHGHTSEPAVEADWLKQRVVACAACHGPNGVSDNPAFPVIAGQPTSYLVHAMTAYRDGTRDNVIMNAQMQGLTDVQIQALAIYYHRHSTPLMRRVD